MGEFTSETVSAGFGDVDGGRLTVVLIAGVVVPGCDDPRSVDGTYEYVISYKVGNLLDFLHDFRNITPSIPFPFSFLTFVNDYAAQTPQRPASGFGRYQIHLEWLPAFCHFSGVKVPNNANIH